MLRLYTLVSGFSVHILTDIEVVSMFSSISKHISQNIQLFHFIHVIHIVVAGLISVVDPQHTVDVRKVLDHQVWLNPIRDLWSSTIAANTEIGEVAGYISHEFSEKSSIFSDDCHTVGQTCTLQRKHSLVCLASQCEDVQRAERWGDFCYANSEEYFTLSKLFARGVIWLRFQLTVYLHLNIWVSVCLWQMASVSHLYSCFFTDELVSNVFSVAFRSVMMIRSYVWEKICIYFCTEKI